MSPISVAHFSQYKLTGLLVKLLKNLGIRICTSEGPENFNHDPLRGREILMGHERVSIDMTDQCVTATVSSSKEGKSMKYWKYRKKSWNRFER